jgi:hypothetical protein
VGSTLGNTTCALVMGRISKRCCPCHPNLLCRRINPSVHSPAPAVLPATPDLRLIQDSSEPLKPHPFVNFGRFPLVKIPSHRYVSSSHQNLINLLYTFLPLSLCKLGSRPFRNFNFPDLKPLTNASLNRASLVSAVPPHERRGVLIFP